MLAVQKETQDLLTKLKTFKAEIQEDYNLLARWKIEAKSRRDVIKMVLDPGVKNSKEAYDKNRAERDKYLKPVVECEDILKRKIKDYEDKKAFEAEQKRKKDAMEAKKEQERLQKIADEEAEAEAKEFGVPVEDVEKEEVEQEYIAPVHNIDKASGLGIRRTWKAQVIDISKVPVEYLMPNMPMLNAKARADQKDFNLPGCVAIYD